MSVAEPGFKKGLPCPSHSCSLRQLHACTVPRSFFYNIWFEIAFTFQVVGIVWVSFLYCRYSRMQNQCCAEGVRCNQSLYLAGQLDSYIYIFVHRKHLYAVLSISPLFWNWSQIGWIQRYAIALVASSFGQLPAVSIAVVSEFVHSWVAPSSYMSEPSWPKRWSQKKYQSVANEVLKLGVVSTMSTTKSKCEPQGCVFMHERKVSYTQGPSWTETQRKGTKSDMWHGWHCVCVCVSTPGQRVFHRHSFHRFPPLSTRRGQRDLQSWPLPTKLHTGRSGKRTCAVTLLHFSARCVLMPWLLITILLP